MAETERFGVAPDGRDVLRLRIRAGGLTAHVLTWGAVVQDLRVDGHRPPLVLGFDRFDPYPARSPYFGAIVGRYANRIAGGRFSLAGRVHQADTNFRARHLLHGGKNGTSARSWTLAAHGADFVTLEFEDRDGTMGFPGNLAISCTYRIAPPSTLSVELVATTDAPTLCNLAHHSYFNLDDGGATSVLDHRLTILADAFLPVDADLIPTGEIAAVEGTDFDFRSVRAIRRMRDGVLIDYDHNWCLAPARRAPVAVARLAGARSGLSMELVTGEPGVQFYAGGSIADAPPGLDSIAYARNAGLCLEPQVWPDAPNRPAFPQAVLRPGETYRQSTAYRFARSGLD